MIEIGSLVGMIGYSTEVERPIGIVIGHDRIYNVVEWINRDKNHQENGGYVSATLEILSPINKTVSE